MAEPTAGRAPSRALDGLGAALAPVVVEVTRENVVESRHRASLVLLDAAGEITVEAGATAAAFLPRSALKPGQAVAMVEAGFPGRGAALALAAASHDGEPMHLAGVRAVLAAAGLAEEALQCPPDLPLGADAARAWLRAGGGPERVCHNCSGKHAAMLATCVAAGWPTASYLDPGHPLQLAARQRIEQLTGEAIDTVTVDGCGAPAFATSLVGLARLGAAIADGNGAPGEVREAMRAFPQLVSGTRQASAAFAGEVAGLVAKYGAEGVWVAALPDGRAFAAKVEDGAARVLAPLLAAVLRHWGFDGPAVRTWSAVPTLGGGRPIGEIRPSAELRALLSLT
ncbi:asparaginase [uncultured Jatrophihabitans sp.]|uniref:asparaginase n=1 Tax=uncultured Jatrophihabitans sp. TaxID=1610747 RepID=UPI0035CBC440